MTRAYYKRAVPYAEDAMNLPVLDVDAAIPFYEKVFAFKLMSRSNTPHKTAVLARDDVEIGLAENGGDPTQEGCFFEVDSVEAAFAELMHNGLEKDDPKYGVENYGDSYSYRVFHVLAPDGLCYCIAEPIQE
jgi:predicted enzyme related to lactoylglutathione lyase